ncbi:MAG: serine/threonine protein phosphatase [Spartobacteria bacterium]
MQPFVSRKILRSSAGCANLHGGSVSDPHWIFMQQVKDTLRATVRIGYDGKVYKQFRGPKAEERFENEVKVLRYLEKRACPFVPRLVESDAEALKIVTTNCGTRVDHLDDARCRELFAELEPYGVRHDDADIRNVTYRQADGRFCLIDFEFATILEPEP